VTRFDYNCLAVSGIVLVGNNRRARSHNTIRVFRLTKVLAFDNCVPVRLAGRCDRQMPWVLRKTFLCTGLARQNIYIYYTHQNNGNIPEDILVMDNQPCRDVNDNILPQICLNYTTNNPLSLRDNIIVLPVATDIPVFPDANGSILVLFDRPDTPNKKQS